MLDWIGIDSGERSIALFDDDKVLASDLIGTSAYSDVLLAASSLRTLYPNLPRSINTADTAVLPLNFLSVFSASYSYRLRLSCTCRDISDMSINGRPPRQRHHLNVVNTFVNPVLFDAFNVLASFLMHANIAVSPSRRLG